jgi:hypothetical protein
MCEKTEISQTSFSKILIYCAKTKGLNLKTDLSFRGKRDFPLLYAAEHEKVGQFFAAEVFLFVSKDFEARKKVRLQKPYLAESVLNDFAIADTRTESEYRSPIRNLPPNIRRRRFGESTMCRRGKSRSHFCRLCRNRPGRVYRPRRPNLR